MAAARGRAGVTAAAAGAAADDGDDMQLDELDDERLAAATPLDAADSMATLLPSSRGASAQGESGNGGGGGSSSGGSTAGPAPRVWRPPPGGWPRWLMQAYELALRARLWPAPGARTLPVPATAVLGTIAGITGAVIALVYEELLYLLLHLTWKTVFDAYRNSVPASVPSWTYILIATPILCGGFAAALVLLPPAWTGAMPDLLQRLHSDEPRVPWQWSIGMFILSMFTIMAGVPIGPELAVLVIAASLADIVVGRLPLSAPIRRVLLLGTMISALSTFFRVPMGALVFTLELPHRFGIEYYEAIPLGAVAALMSSMVSTSILGEVIGGRFMFPETTEEVDADARAIFWAAVLGLVASFGMYGFYKLYSFFVWVFDKANLTKRHALRVAVGTVGLLLLFILVPATMFWSADELQFVLNEHVEPLPNYGGEFQGVLPLPTRPAVPGTPTQLSHWSYLIIAIFKFVAVAWAMAVRFRGGIIFPLIYTGVALGRALGDLSAAPSVSVTMLSLALGIGFVVSATKTPFGSPLVMSLSTSFNGGPPRTLDLLAVTAAAGFAAIFGSAGWKLYPTQGPRASPPPCLVADGAAADVGGEPKPHVAATNGAAAMVADEDGSGSPTLADGDLPPDSAFELATFAPTATSS